MPKRDVATGLSKVKEKLSRNISILLLTSFSSSAKFNSLVFRQDVITFFSKSQLQQLRVQLERKGFLTFDFRELYLLGQELHLTLRELHMKLYLTRFGSF